MIISEETLSDVLCLLRHPKNTLYALVSLLRNMPDGGRSAECRMLRNLVLSLPERLSVPFRDEIEFLLKCEPDFLAQSVFPYSQVREFPDVQAGFDAQRGLPYVVHKGKRLYFPKGFSVVAAKSAYAELAFREGLVGDGCLRKSPHAYVTGSFHADAGDVVLDIGCAEALFALDSVMDVRKVYAFEVKKKWRGPLQATFQPFRDRVVLVNKLVGGESSGNCIRLMDAVAEAPGSSYFMKMDIEGGERVVLEDSSEFLRKNKVKLACCVYHRQDDERVIVEMLKGLGFSVEISDGYMLPRCGGVSYPYFRKGVVYARNF